jgi:hypothetical protein
VRRGVGGGVVNGHGCYSDSWQGVITPDAFAHPAKYARGLIRRIYQHMLDSGYVARGDSIIDPFGGVGLGGLDAMTFGLHWTGCELEPRFVELGQRNLDKWRRDLAMLNGTLGTARLLQGDSRRLLEVVGAGMAAAVSSPPFGEAQTYGTAIVYPNGDRIQDRAYSPENQGQSPGNLAALRADDAGFTAAVSSPPYADNAATWVEGPGARHDPIHHNGDNAYKASSDSGYGSTPGNVGNMRDGGFEGVVSSPPFESSGTDRNETNGVRVALNRQVVRKNRGASIRPGEQARSLSYGDDPANIGNDSGDNFWTAARAIVEQTYAVLRPGGYAAWVCKDFVRKGQRVPFSDQWQALCAAVGFVPVERIAAMLVDDHGDQLDIFGGVTARRKEVTE